MASLADYNHFRGRHPVTGSISNALAYAGIVAPHTGEPLSEALLAGVAGGVAFGYFYFQYEGFDPQVNIVTRNSFHEYGYETIRDRLRIPQEVLQTTSADKAADNLTMVLEQGAAPIVWADVLSFPYEESELGEDMWMMTPILVYHYEEEEAALADRTEAPMVVSRETLDRARGRVKKERYRIVTLDRPDLDSLPEAVTAGISECLALYTEKPPKGSAQNWGFNGLQRLRELLTKPTAKGSWAKVLSSRRELYAGLLTAYKYGLLFWKDDSETADRQLYASFLREAADILGQPAAADAAEKFEEAAVAWRDLGRDLLPDDVSQLRETRELMHRRHATFLSKGTEGLSQIREIDSRLETLKGESEDLPLSDQEVQALRERISEGVSRIEESERRAVDALRSVVE